MKKITLLAILAIAAFSNNANAQSTASATATATIVTPIAIKTNVNMSFGAVAITGAAGTVVLSTSGDRTGSTDITLSTVGVVTAASFEVNGTADYTYSVKLPTDPVILKNSGASATMNVTNFTKSLSGNGMLTNGNEKFTVGGTLNVAASQAAGKYEGIFDVIVNYN